MNPGLVWFRVTAAPGVTRTSRPRWLPRGSGAAAGLTQEQLAAAVFCHPSLIARIETCRAVPTLDFARRSDQVLATNGVLTGMQPQATRASSLPGIGPYPQIGKFLSGFGQYLQIEGTADLLRFWEPLVVPGLLAYLEALLAGWLVEDSELVRRGDHPLRHAEGRGFVSAGLGRTTGEAERRVDLNPALWRKAATASAAPTIASRGAQPPTWSRSATPRTRVVRF